MSDPHLLERRGVDHRRSRGRGLLLAQEVELQRLSEELLAADRLRGPHAIPQVGLERLLELAVRHKPLAVEQRAVPRLSTLDALGPAHRAAVLPRSDGQLSVLGRDEVQRCRNFEKAGAAHFLRTLRRLRPHQCLDQFGELSVVDKALARRGDVELD